MSRKKLATIYPKDDKYIAKILYENALKPVVYFVTCESPLHLHNNLLMRIANIEIVPRQRFELELSYIKLFKCRSDDDLERKDKVTDEEVIKYLT